MSEFSVSTELHQVLDFFNMNYTDYPYWSESSWFSWAIPERNINGLFYVHFRPNMNCVNAGTAMWDTSGQHVWQFLYYDWQCMRIPPKLSLEDGIVRSSTKHCSDKIAL